MIKDEITWNHLKPPETTYYFNENTWNHQFLKGTDQVEPGRIWKSSVNIFLKSFSPILLKFVIGTPWTQDVNWTYIRRSEDVLDVSWKSYVCSIYVLCLLGSQLLNFILLYCSHLSYTSLCIQSTVGVDYKAVGATLHSSKSSQLSGFTTVAIWATTHSILSEFPLALAQTMVSAGKKAKCLPSVNYSTKPIQQLSELIIVPVGATSSFN